MRRRLLGITIAVVLGLVGTTALVLYVRSAHDRAAEPEAVATVLVLDRTVRAGTSVADLGDAVVPVEIPTRLVAPGAVEDLGRVAGDLVAAVELRPGEQLLRSRLVPPAALVRTEVPAGLQEVTVALGPDRAVGGVLRPGDTVGVVISFEPFERSAVTPTGEGEDPAAGEATANRTPNTTHLTLQQVLVTAVQYSQRDAERATASRSGDEEEVIDATIAESPGDQLLVTLALTGPEVEQVVFAAEFGRIWLTLQDGATDTEGTRILTLDQVYVEVPR